MRQVIRIVIGSALLLCGLAIAGIVGLLASHSGSQWLIQHIPQVQVQNFQGRLGSRWQADQIRWHDDSQDIQLNQVRMQWRPACLLRLHGCIEQLSAQSARINRTAAQTETPQSAITLPALPIDLGVTFQQGTLEELWLNQQAVAQHIQLSGSLESQGGWALRLEVRLQTPASQPHKLTVHGIIHGTLQDSLQLTLDGQGDWQGRLSGQISALDPTLPLALTLDSDAITLPLGTSKALRMQGLRLTAMGNTQTGYQLLGQGKIQDQTQNELALDVKAHLDTEQLRLEQLTLSTDAHHYLRLSGRVQWPTQLQADIQLEGQDVPWQMGHSGSSPAIQLKHLKGQLHYQTQAYQGQLQAMLQGPAGAFRLETSLQGDATHVRLPQLDITADKGRVQGQLALDWAQSLRWQAQLALKSFNPAYWVAELPGQIAGTLNTSGQMQHDAPEGMLQLALTGQLRRASAQLDVRLHTQKGLWTLEQLNGRWGENRIQGQGQWGEQLQGQLRLNLNKLAQLWPDTKGQLNGSIKLAGTPQRPQFELNLNAPLLQYSGYAARELKITGSVSAAQQAQLSVQVKELINHQTPWGALTFSAEGTPERHQARLQLTGTQGAGNLQLSGQYTEQRWRGQLLQAFVETMGQHWRLDRATALEYRPQNQQLLWDAHCWRFQEASLCAPNQRLMPNPQLNYQLKNFPLNGLAHLLPNEIQWPATLNGQWTLNSSPKGPDGSLHLEASPCTLQIREGSHWYPLTYQELALNVQLTPQQTRVQLNIQGQTLGHLSLHAQLDPQKPQKPLEGNFKIQGLDLALLRPFLPSVEQLKGQLEGAGTLGGSLQRPQLTGQIQLTEGWIRDAQLPTALEHLQLTLNIAGTRMEATGQWRSGAQGRAQINGTLNWGESLQMVADLTGQQLPLQLEPYANLQAEPQLHIQFSEHQTQVTGQLLIPKGQISIRELPPETVKVSSDAVLVGQTAPEQEPSHSPTSLKMDVSVKVGNKKDAIAFSGFGLKADLSGQLHLGDDLDARGELKLLNGRYKAYGQNLTVRQAQILFTGPITTPFLTIEAVRRIEADSVTAGLRITGNSQQPKVEVFSEPSLGQEQALSYLVMGRALGSQTGDSNMLAQAAVGLGLSGATPITSGISSLANRLGIQDFQLDTENSSTNASNTNLVASGRLTDRLTLRYGAGIFESSNTLSLRYQLTQKLFLEAASGLSSSLDFFYRRDF